MCRGWPGLGLIWAELGPHYPQFGKFSNWSNCFGLSSSRIGHTSAKGLFRPVLVKIGLTLVKLGPTWPKSGSTRQISARLGAESRIQGQLLDTCWATIVRQLFGKSGGRRDLLGVTFFSAWRATFPLPSGGFVISAILGLSRDVAITSLADAPCVRTRAPST